MSSVEIPMGRRRYLLALSLVLASSVPALAADDWIEVTSPRFVVVSNAGERASRTLAWQLEQVSSAMRALWAWARVELDRPLCVIALENENSMRLLAPQYWENRSGIRPASVWVSGPARHYLAIRTDVRASDTDTTNPHISAYFSYISLMMGQSLDPDLPLWFSRGLAGVLSNTLVRDDHVLVGAPIPWELRRLRESPRIPLSRFLAVTRRSPEFNGNSQRQTFDAQAWAFVHFLMFGESGKRAEALERFAGLVTGGRDVEAAFAETLGPVDALAGPFARYVDRSLFTYGKLELDVSVERERFPVRKLAPADSAATRAGFHAAMRRPQEARALIAEARKADPLLPESYVVEGMVFDFEEKPDEARAAFARAAELGSTSAYAHYRLAGLMWRPDPDRETLVEIEKRLRQAVQLNNRLAGAYSWLGEITAALGSGDAMGLVARAISLEPREATHRMRAAMVLWRQQKLDDAQAQARTALALAGSDDERARAQELLDRIGRAKGGGSHES